MKLKCTAREKLVEKDIDWKQVYTDKTLFLKEQFEDVIGAGSYFRFEGDASDGDSYYCILGPAKIHHPRAKFFAGVRKLPATFSAGGKYFDSLDSAATYARETWGVETPRSLRPYTSAQLHGISEKITKWKEQRDKEEENDSKDGKEASRSLDFRIVEAARGSGPDYEASRPKRVVPNAPVEVRDQQSKELIGRIEKSEWGGIVDEYGEEVLAVMREEFARQTGVGSQVGELSWDDRSTVENVSKEGALTVLDLVMATDDILARNPKIEGLRWDEGTKTYRMPINGKDRYCTVGARQSYLNLIENTKHRIMNRGSNEEERGDYEGDTSQVFNNPYEEDHEDEDFIQDYLAFSDKDKVILSKTLKNLVKIAADCDSKGDTSDAEEIHKVIRKYKEEVA